MAPMRVVQVKLWQVAVAFVMVTATFVIGLVAVTGQVQGNHDSIQRIAKVSKVANRTAQQLKTSRTALLKIRNAQLQTLHDQDVRTCERVHAIDKVMQGVLTRAIKQGQDAAPFPGLTPEQQAELNRRNQAGIVILQQGVGELVAADCTGVEKLPTTTTTSPAPG